MKWQPDSSTDSLIMQPRHMLCMVCVAGMMVGKALYEGILLNLSFAPFFIRCLQVSRCTLKSCPA